MRIHHILLAAALCLHLNAFCDEAKPAAPQPQQAEATQQAEESQEEDSFDLLESIALLKPGSVVLQVADKKVTWREIQPSIKEVLNDITMHNNKKAGIERIREIFQEITSRGLLLCEAEAMKLTVSDEERKEFEDDLEKGLEGNTQGMTKEKFIASFGNAKSTIVHLSYADALKLIKLNKVKFGDIRITEQELDICIKYKQAINQQCEQKNAETRGYMDILLKQEQIKTDDGFMDFAKRFSEGTESDNGGILNYDYTREELAEINELKSFDWKVGETTPLLETKTDFRIMRILSALPRKNDKEPEKYRVAQILHSKLPITDITDKQAIIDEMLPKKKKYLIDMLVQSLNTKYTPTSPLFPNGIWEKDTETEADIEPQTTQNPQNNEKK